MQRAALTARDLTRLEKSFITPELAAQAGLFRVDSQTGAQIVGRKGGGDYSGIVFPYYWPGEDNPREYRLRRDEPDLEQGSDGSIKERAKYLSPPGKGNMLYFPPGVKPAWLEDASLPIVMTEGEKKTLALWRLGWHGIAGDKSRFLPIGVAGVWNWRGVIGKIQDERGARRDYRGVIADFDRIVWRGRIVYIIFDANVATNENVQAARRELAKELMRRGAIVRFVDLPVSEGINGVDDLLTVKGPEYVLALIDSAHEVADNNGSRAIKPADEHELQRLAALPLLDYERTRKDAAQSLGCRPATLDKLVDSKREKKSQGALQGSGLKLADVEPWPESVKGGDVLAEVSETFTRYMVLPPGAADVLALWCAYAHGFDAFVCSPRLNVSSPEKGCGKTTLLDVIAGLVPRPLPTENLTVAVLFRVIESHSPTLLADECDSWLTDNEELRGLLNAGHRRGGQVFRCEGESREVRAFNVFGPAVLCGIGSLPGTLQDRSIRIQLERAKPSEMRERFDSRHTEREQELCRKLARFTADNRMRLEACDPALPQDVFNRQADNWRPLFAIAAIAGGEWPERINAAYEKLRSKDADGEGLAIMLLADLRQVFSELETERLFSKALVSELTALTDRPWPEARKGHPITETWLARKLKPFGILSKSVRVETENAKGYELASFSEAFARYLPPVGVSSRHSVTSPENINESGFSKRHNDKTCDGMKMHETPINIGVCQCDALNPPDLVIGEI